MHGISIDLGTYSLKFLTYQIDKKTIQFTSSEEIVLFQDEFDINDPESLWALQLKVINEFLSEVNYEYQLLIHAPSDISSTRYVSLPVKNKKRAAMMLAFKIEEDLPYSLSDCHYAESIKITGLNTQALVSIIKKDSFEIFFDLLQRNNITPKVLTTDVSIFANHVEDNQLQFPENFAIIELGHLATRGYFYNNGKLVSNHTSYLAGQIVTEAISRDYNISIDEATLYKHQNAFTLTQEQYDQVNQDQIAFAKLMDKTLEPLISEIKRWDIGYRVQHGIPPQEIYLCGGTSNIKNIHNYLHSKLAIKVTYLDTFNNDFSAKIDSDQRLRRKFSLLSLLSQNAPKKNKMINFLKGDYALQSNIELPTQGIVFIASRLLIISVILCAILSFEALFINKSLKQADKRIASLLKNPVIKISPQAKRMTKKKPLATLKLLKKINKNITQEIKTIQSSLETNALKNLNDIVNEISGFNVEVETFNSVNEREFSLTLHSQDITQLEELEEALNANKSRRLFTELNKDKKILSISGEEGK